MKQAEAESAIRSLATKWAREVGFLRDSGEQPSYNAFRAWVQTQGYGQYLEFRSTIGAYEHAEMWFDNELGQSWRN